MPDPVGFLKYDRRLPARRPVPVRIKDWREVYPPAPDELIREQAGRCMDCGIPFCHDGCPLGNRIPDWNDLVRTGDWEFAIESLHATNNFPEFTGRLCPAPCEAACVLSIAGPRPEPAEAEVAGAPGIAAGPRPEPAEAEVAGASGIAAGGQPVTIKQVEVEIINRAVAAGRVGPRPAPEPSGKSVGVVGSGPAGLAAAQQLARAGHAVTVYERDDALGGLLRYGIPDFKLEKERIDARLVQLADEGVVFEVGVNVGTTVSVGDLRARHDALLLACGALAARDTPDTPGRDLGGVHLAMEHLVESNRFVAGRAPGVSIDAKDKRVIIIGGGDTAADCLGVAHRQGARSVTQLDQYPLPPDERDETRDPWPTWPTILRNYPAHEEGGERSFAVAVVEYLGDEHGHVRAIKVQEVEVSRVDGRRVVTYVPGTVQDIPADLVLLAIGFDGTEDGPLTAALELDRNARGGVDCGPDWQTPAPGVFVAGDMHRGASLIVWAIAEGRSAAAAIHAYLGGAGVLPAPVHPFAVPLHA